MAALLWAGKPDLFVHGPSDSGKSSLIQAGIIPDILCGVYGTGEYVPLVIRPM